MKQSIIYSLLVLSLFSSCSDNGNSSSDIKEVKSDTEAEPVEESPGTSGNNKKTIPASAKLVSLAGETDIEKLLCQGWVMDDDADVLASNNDPEGNYPYRCIYFFDDKTYTRNVRNAMEHGSWQYDAGKKMVTVKASNGSTDEYKIAAIGANDMIVLNNSSNSATKLTYLADGVRYKDKNEDPFYIENNRWRIKPAKSETDEQVHQRLKAFVYFHILFYRDNLERKEKLISFYGFPSCVKWYGGGIGMINVGDLPGNWINCFYNKEQAIKAQKLMDGIISKKYKWSTGKVSWVKKNLEVLEQMYANL
jgi:hypothetical protein